MTKNTAAPATTAPATTKKSTAPVEATSVVTPEASAATKAATASEAPAKTNAPATPVETMAATAETPAETPPVEASAPAVATATSESKKIDLGKPQITEAIAKGKALIKEGKTKADAAMAIFEALKAEEKDVVIAAFVQGATLTEKGAVTYWYNCRRKARKANPASK